MLCVSELGGNAEGATWRRAGAPLLEGEVTDPTLLPLVLSPQLSLCKFPQILQLSEEVWVL